MAKDGGDPYFSNELQLLQQKVLAHPYEVYLVSGICVKKSYTM